MNGAIGVGGVWNTGHRIFKNERGTGCYRLLSASGRYTFDSGYGLYARASADIYDFRVKTSYWTCKDFISMFGSPFSGRLDD